MAENSLTYSKASEELQEILEELEGENIEIDNLSTKVKRATELIKFCREKLKSTEVEIKKITKDIADQNDDKEVS